MIFGSVCSGIEAASVAWHPLGWSAAWLSEIESFPSKALAHHYPDVPNLGDMTKIARLILIGEIVAPDVLIGGTPCQAFSIAGLRKGLDDARGQLTLSYVRLLDAIDYIRGRSDRRAAIGVWENVPGVLSDKSNAFGCLLAGLAGEDVELKPPGKKWANAGCVFGPTRTVAWRTLDAQYFGLAQRRRRVFVIASARKGFDPCKVLFEFDGLRRDSPPSRGAGQETAGTLASRTGAGGFPGTDEACSGYLQPVALSVALRGRDGGATAELGDTLAGCLRASQGGGDKPHVLAFDSRQETVSSEHVFGALSSSSPQAQAVAYSIQAGALRTNPLSGPDGVGVQEGIAYTIEARSEVQAIAFAENSRGEVRLEGGDGSRTGALSTGGGKPGQGTPMVVFQTCGSNLHVGDIAATIGTNAGSATGSAPMFADMNLSVRRLMPIECERLQGFPDGYTAVPQGKRKAIAKDGPRYRSIGNSMAVPCMAWIGRRIAAQIRAPA